MCRTSSDIGLEQEDQCQTRSDIGSERVKITHIFAKNKKYFTIVNGELTKEALNSGTEPLFDSFSSKQEIMCYK